MAMHSFQIALATWASDVRLCCTYVTLHVMAIKDGTAKPQQSGLQSLTNNTRMLGEIQSVLAG